VRGGFGRRTARAITALISFSMIATGSVMARGSSSLSQLRVTPSAGHAGDNIDLSGSGFPAYTHLNILMACPNWQAENAVRLGNVVIISGPTTNGRGQFSGFLFRAIRLHGVPQSTCQIQASVGDNAFGVDIPAVYLIVPHGQPLKLGRCQRQLTVCGLQVQPREVHSGYDEKISLRTWPGALVSTTYTYPGKSQTVDYHHADWTGMVQWAKRIAGSVSSGTVQVRAGAALGPMSSGYSTSRFTVVH
jgi:hypothetical protein